MFDPTAFENMKVVLEGALYDRDLMGEITIVDRNDVMNTAKLSRMYEIQFSKKTEKRLLCTVRMEAGLENLAAELLHSNQSEKLSGCHVSILFSFQHMNEMEKHKEIDQMMKEIWGIERNYQHRVIINPFEKTDRIEKEIVVQFNRIIYEEQMDDLVDMIDYMLVSLERLQPYCI